MLIYLHPTLLLFQSFIILMIFGQAAGFGELLEGIFDLRNFGRGISKFFIPLYNGV
jgi:hypothetical protein